MNFPESLSALGFTAEESALYIAALQNGASTALALARITKLNRPLVNKLLSRFVSEGLFNRLVVGKRALYAAIPPRQLLTYFRRKESLLEELIPDLESLASLGQERPTIQFYEGREELQRLLRTQNTARHKEIYSYFPSKYMLQLFGKRQLESVIRERVRKGIKVKLLRQKSSEREYEGWELREEALREVRLVSETDNKKLRMGIIIFDNKVNIFSPIEENFGLQIESRSLASLWRCFFEALWEKSEIG